MVRRGKQMDERQRTEAMADAGADGSTKAWARLMMGLDGVVSEVDAEGNMRTRG